MTFERSCLIPMRGHASMIAWITSAALVLGVPVAVAQEAMVVGAVVSQSGAHTGPAAEYRQGLLLWRKTSMRPAACSAARWSCA
jgi:hypothetical protein